MPSITGGSGCDGGGCGVCASAYAEHGPVGQKCEVDESTGWIYEQTFGEKNKGKSSSPSVPELNRIMLVLLML